jgi:ABC-type sugar transport system substrate-binding protein
VNIRKGIAYLGSFAAVFACTRAAAVHEHGCLVQLLGDYFTNRIEAGWEAWDEDLWMHD